MLNKNLQTVLESPFTLKQVPDAIPADIRPLWRFAICLAILNCSRGGTASMKKLQVLSWVVGHKENHEIVLNALESNFNRKNLLIRYDPALDRALDFAIGEKIIEFTSSAKYKISESGRKVFKEIETGNGLENEIEFLKAHGSKFLEGTIDDLLNWNL